MASIQDLILNAVKGSIGNVEIPSNITNQVVSGLSESILGGLTQTAVKPGGLELVKGLLTGKQSAATSPVTALIGKIFSGNAAKKLGLGSALTTALVGLLPKILGNLSGMFKDQDGDGGGIDQAHGRQADGRGGAQAGADVLGHAQHRG